MGKFAKYLHEQGHDVHILAANDKFYPKELLLEIPIEHVTYTTPFQVNAIPYKVIGKDSDKKKKMNNLVGTFDFLGKFYRTLINFPDGQIGWFRRAVKAGSKIVHDWKPDIIYASAMPFTSLMVARHLSQKSGTPYICELRDLWVNSHYYSHPRWRKIIEDRLEQATLSKAAALVTVSEPLADTLREKYGIPTYVALNGFDPTDLPEFESNSGTGDGIVRIVYTGMIYPGRRDPSPLFAALRALGNNRHKFRVDFYGRNLNEVNPLAESYGVSDIVHTHATVPYEEAITIQSKADVLLLMLWDTPAEFGVYTGKLFEYLGARRPILCLGPKSGVAVELIRMREAGFVSNDTDTLSEQLMEWSRQKKGGGIPALPKSVQIGLTREEQFSSLVSSLECDVLFDWAKRVNIRFVINRFGVGGTERHLLQVLPKLDRQRFNVSVQTTRGGGSLENTLRRAGIPLFSPSPSLPGFIQQLWTLFRVWRDINCNRVDIIHFFLPEAYILGGMVSALYKRNRLITIMSRRNLNVYQRRHFIATLMERWLHKKMGALIGNSQAVVSQLAEETHEKSKIGLIYNGIDLSFYASNSEKSNIRKELGLQENAVVMTIVANLIPYKGHADLLAALRQINDELPQPWALLCIGRDDGIGKELKLTTEKYGLMENVHWFGERPDVRKYLATADIGILCSHEEGFSNSILEGMAHSLPMVVTNVGGNPEAVVNEKTGIIVPPASPDFLARAIVRLAWDSTLRKRMGEAGRCRVEQSFSLDRCVASYTKLYEGIDRMPGQTTTEIIKAPSDFQEESHHDG